MIVLAGLSHDRTLVHTAAVAQQLSVPFRFLDLARFCECGSWEWDFDLRCGRINIGEEIFDFRNERISGVYARLVDISSTRQYDQIGWSTRTRALQEMVHNMGCRVVNRPQADLTNSSKLYQLFLLADCGFEVPASILTNSGAFGRTLTTPERMIYKGASSQCTIATLLKNEHFSSMEALKNSPVLFQEFVSGRDLRVHIVAGVAFGEMIEKQRGHVDYRFSKGCKFEKFDPPASIIQKCNAYMLRSGLDFVGFDFILQEPGRFVALEANPMPGYDGYDRRANSAIAQELVKFLSAA